MRQRTSIYDRQTFSLDGDFLIRKVVTCTGHYSHKCSLRSFKEVLHYLELNDGVTSNTMWNELDIPCTQISVALAFLKERGCVVVDGRKVYSSSDVLYEDGMTELYAMESQLWT